MNKQILEAIEKGPQDVIGYGSAGAIRKETTEQYGLRIAKLCGEVAAGVAVCCVSVQEKKRDQAIRDKTRRDIQAAIRSEFDLGEKL